MLYSPQGRELSTGGDRGVGEVADVAVGVHGGVSWVGVEVRRDEVDERALEGSAGRVCAEGAADDGVYDGEGVFPLDPVASSRRVVLDAAGEALQQRLPGVPVGGVDLLGDRVVVPPLLDDDAQPRGVAG